MMTDDTSNTADDRRLLILAAIVLVAIIWLSLVHKNPCADFHCLTGESFERAGECACPEIE